jgi:hypothetical protein
MPPPDFSARKDVRKAEKLAAQKAAARIAYTKSIMATTMGREWIHDLLERGHLFGAAFIRSAPDLTAYNLGTQEFAKEIFWEIVTHSPNEYVLMMQEASIRETSNGRRTEHEHAGERDRGQDGIGGTAGPEPDLDESIWGPTDGQGGGETGSGS